MLSPSAALRAVPTCSGPVGLALTNSTWTRPSLATGSEPNCAPSARMVLTCSRSQSSASVKFKNPGAAASTPAR